MLISQALKSNLRIPFKIIEYDLPSIKQNSISFPDINRANSFCDLVRRCPWSYSVSTLCRAAKARVHGNQKKTDRIDASKLAQFYASGLLTVVTPPEVEMEKDRDLMRSRQFILHQLSEIRTHIQSLLRRNNLNYKSETSSQSHWTKNHLCWLARIFHNDCVISSFKIQ